MPPSRVILRFLVVWVALCIVVLPRWEIVEKSYAVAFRAAGNVVFSRFGIWDASVVFLDTSRIEVGELPPGIVAPKAAGVRETLLKLVNRNIRSDFGFLRCDSWHLGYIPTAMFLAVLTATPAPLRRKMIAMGWGLLFVHAFIYLRTFLLIVTGFMGNKAYALFHPGPTIERLIGMIERVMQEDPTVSYVAPIFIWVLVLFRPGSWNLDGAATAQDIPQEKP